VRDPSATLLALALVLGACAEDELVLPPLEYESRRARVGLGDRWVDSILCPGDLDAIDQRIEFIENRLGVSRDEPIDIYWLWYDDDIRVGPCKGEHAACYTTWDNGDDAIFTALWQNLDHELVHAVARGIEFPSLFWNEGCAELLSGKATRKAERTVLTPEDLEAQSLTTYTTAAHFSRFLVETRGWEGYNRIIRGESFEAVYGESVAEVTDEYEAEAPFSYPPLEPCPFPPLPETGYGWGDTIRLACEDPTATGTKHQHGPIVRRTIELAGGTYAFRVRGPIRYYLTGCHTDVLSERTDPPSSGDLYNEVDLVPPREFGPTGIQVLDLPEGTYRISPLGWHGEDLHAEIAVSEIDWDFPEE
jgi:hypothetical protein